MAEHSRGLRHELLLLPLLAVEVAAFAVCGQNFLTATNAFEIVRVSVEVGLLALALTLVIVAGGIDLSVGSTMGLVAVALGWLCLAQGWPVWLAVPAVLLLGALAGGLNGWLVSRLGLPPLIVTLGTWSLYRGLAEGVTHGIVNYTGFPTGFLALGQGYFGGVVPRQLPLFVAVAIGFALLLHATVYGRTLYAVGHSPAGARHAGVPVARRVAASYVLSGLTAALAGVIYVARVGQAKADAGTNYELLAITAVVLGGTSIFGGRGTIGGTLLGLYAIVLLENGLRLAGQPAELAGILTGALLLGAIAAPTAWRSLASEERTVDGELDMKNSQVVWLSVVMLLCALIVAGSNFVVASHLKALEAGLPAERPVTAPGPSRPGPGPAEAPLPPSAKRYVVAMMPKSKGDPYFVSCREGAEAAAKEVGVDLLWDGPTETDAAKQNEVVETWITKGVDCLAVSVQNPEAIATVLRKARAKGMPVLTWDADALPDARDFLINQATPEGIGFALVDEANRVLGGKGKFAIITSTLTDANQNEWIKHIKRRMAQYPGLELAVTKPSNGLLDRALSETQDVLKAYPEVKLVMAIAAPAVPGAAEAVQQSGRSDVKVIGLSLPSMCKSYIHKGTVDCIVLWKTWDLGYLTVRAAKALCDGTLRKGATSLDGGKLGSIEIKGSEILLGKPFVFTKENVDQFDF